MARESTSASNYLQHETDLGLSAYPVSMSVWFYPNSDTATYDVPIFLGQSDVDTHHLQLIKANTDSLWAQAKDGGISRNAVTTNTVTANTWQHGIAIFTSTTSRKAILNGDLANAGTNGATAAFPNADRFTLYDEGDSSRGQFFNGRLAEAAVWSASLSDNEAKALAFGVTPLRIRPANLVGYWPMYGSSSGDEYDYSGNGRTLTETGTVTVAAHAPVAPIFPIRAYSFPTAILPKQGFILQWGDG